MFLRWRSCCLLSDSCWRGPGTLLGITGAFLLIHKKRLPSLKWAVFLRDAQSMDQLAKGGESRMVSFDSLREVSW